MGRTEFNKAKLEEQSFKQLLGSKKDITLVTMNTNGRGVLGLTPKFKLEMIRQHFAANKPDVVFIQDSIDTSDILELIKKGFPSKTFHLFPHKTCKLKYSRAASPNYEAFFQNGLSSEGDDQYMYEKDGPDGQEGVGSDEQRRPSKPRSLTGVVWDKTKYEGTPLQV